MGDKPKYRPKWRRPRRYDYRVLEDKNAISHLKKDPQKIFKTLPTISN